MPKKKIKKILKKYVLANPKKEEKERRKYEKRLSKLGTVELITISSISGAIASELLRRAIEYKPQPDELNTIQQFIYSIPLLRWTGVFIGLIVLVVIFTGITLWAIEKFSHMSD
jgi:Fe2+ transport system protein B